MAVGDIVSGGGGALASLFGSDEAPKAILNRYAAPTAKASGALSTDLLRDTNALSKQALDTYLGGQGKMTALAGQQEGVLNTLLNRNLNADPNALLQSVGNTAFGFINPSTIAPLAQFDVNQDVLMRRARGLNPAAVSSTADRLRNSRIASQRYYDVAQNAFNALPNLYGQAFQQGQSNEASAAGLIPQIAGAYEGVFSRPTTGLLNRANVAGAAQNVGTQGISNIMGATQGYQQPRNWADRIGAASQDLGGMVNGIAGLMGGGGGGGL